MKSNIELWQECCRDPGEWTDLVSSMDLVDEPEKHLEKAIKNHEDWDAANIYLDISGKRSCFF